MKFIDLLKNLLLAIWKAAGDTRLLLITSSASIGLMLPPILRGELEDATKALICLVAAAFGWFEIGQGRVTATQRRVAISGWMSAQRMKKNE